MKLVGIEKVKYTNKEQRLVEGLKLYYTELVNNDSLTGERTGSVYIPAHACNEIADVSVLSLGDEFDILYNRFGGVKDIKIL